MPSRGRSLAREVEEQLQACDRVIAVIGPQSIRSEACKAERAFAFNAGKVVTAILCKGEYPMLPPELSRYFIPDFQSRPYEAALDELQRLEAPPAIPGQLFDVPAPPPYLQNRPNELSALRESITAAELKEITAITSAGHVGLLGMGGVGKNGACGARGPRLHGKASVSGRHHLAHVRAPARRSERSSKGAHGAGKRRHEV